ncbi:Anaphase-promoting complex subunit 10 [Gaertneriomyces sp. JEL0708]|nr:Anaphase-promoting complex subunit 10 [Gaertneriomyces sp. JEL0708]
MLDGQTDTYWQSDGPQPHFVNLEFPRRMTFTQLSIYVDSTKDESYTPKDITISAGNSLNDLQVLREDSLEGDMLGWLNWPLYEDEEETQPLRANVIQFCVNTNYQNGKDTHVRLLKVFSPSIRLDMLPQDMAPFTTAEYQM